MTFFWILAAVLVASALFTVTQKKPVYSVVGLLVNFIALATVYFALDAEFLAVIQIVVYSGAILMLFVFVIALLSSGIGPFREGPNRLPHVALPAIAIVGLFGTLIVYGVLRSPLAATPHGSVSTLGPAGNANVFGSISDFGVALFTTYLLPFEVTALILMVAVIGVVLIAGDASIQQTLGRHAPSGRKRRRESIVKSR